MEWLTESIEKVICFVQERPFLFAVSSAELARNLSCFNNPRRIQSNLEFIENFSVRQLSDTIKKLFLSTNIVPVSRLLK